MRRVGNKKPMQVFCRGFLLPTRRVDMFGDGSEGRKPFRILFHLEVFAQKVSEFKSESRIRPNLFILSRYFPPFPVPKPIFQISMLCIAPKLRRFPIFKGFRARLLLF
jgi:hypothetical protein